MTTKGITLSERMDAATEPAAGRRCLWQRMYENVLGLADYDLACLYNCCFRGFAIGVIGSALVLKTLVAASFVGSRSRQVLASLTINVVGAVFTVWIPLGVIAAIVASDALGRWTVWSGVSILISALISSGLDALILNHGFGVRPSRRLLGMLFLANAAGLLLGTGLAIYEDYVHPAMALAFFPRCGKSRRSPLQAGEP